MLHARRVVLAGVLVATLLGACGETAAARLKVGDCFDDPTGGVDRTLVSTVPSRPCAEPHDNEVFYVGDMADAPSFPGDAAAEAFVSERCKPAFKAFTGRDFDSDPDYDLNFLTPTASSWSAGDRGVICFVVRVDRTKMTGSAKG